jgi:muconolactone delta-isomerase
VRRIEYGFRQLAKQPRYQDLPAYDALRQLGPLYEAASTIPASTHILMLSSYRVLYEENWLFLSNEIIGCLPSDDWKVLRLVDLGNPQLVSQFLYEQIRRAAACVVDWTEYSPSTFFELGVRLAVSEWGAIQLVDDRYLPEGEQSKRWERMFGQIENMHALFDPFTYRLFGDTSSIRNAIELLLKRSPAMDESHKRDRVYRRVSEAIQDVAETYTPVHKQLIDAADALHHPLQGREGAPQILFRHSRESSSQHAKTESERAAKELRIAAWMYMEYRLKAGYLKRDDPLRQLYEKLGEESASSLFDADEGDLARLILDSLQEKSAETYKPVYKQLIDAADALHHPLQSREGAPRNSGDGSRQLAKIESAKELRIAAWFYMEYRLKPKGELERNEPLRKLYEKLGEESANALFDADEVNLAQRILDSLQKQGKQA